MNILVVCRYIHIKLPKLLIKADKQVLKCGSCYFSNFSKGYNFGSKILIWQSTNCELEGIFIAIPILRLKVEFGVKTYLLCKVEDTIQKIK